MSEVGDYQYVARTEANGLLDNMSLNSTVQAEPEIEVTENVQHTQLNDFYKDTIDQAIWDIIEAEDSDGECNAFTTADDVPE